MEREHTAHHEAGHAVLCYAFDRTVGTLVVGVQPDRPQVAGGVTAQLCVNLDVDGCLIGVAVQCGGTIAAGRAGFHDEPRRFPEIYNAGGTTDWKEAREFAQTAEQRHGVPHETAEDLGFDVAGAVLAELWPFVTRVAEVTLAAGGILTAVDLDREFATLDRSVGPRILAEHRAARGI